MKSKKIPKERNQFVAASLFRKAGKHKLSKRKEDKDKKKINGQNQNSIRYPY